MTTAVVVGGGPNGLAAALTLAREGVDVTVLEASETVGGGARSGELTVPGVIHDHCSAFHPLGVGSPFWAQIGLERYGLTWRWPEIDCAHPLDSGDAGLLFRSIEETAAGLGVSTTLVRTAALGAATLLCAAATAAVGPIAFIGLAVPHIVRGLLGLDMRRQLIGCLLVGPVVLLGADVVGRVLLRPQELMVGVVTAFVGAPILLLAVRRLGRRAQA